MILKTVSQSTTDSDNPTTISQAETNQAIGPVKSGSTYDFDSQLEQALAGAEAATNDEECNKLWEVLLKYKKSFLTDQTDCGLTKHPHGTYTDTTGCPSKLRSPI